MVEFRDHAHTDFQKRIIGVLLGQKHVVVLDPRLSFPSQTVILDKKVSDLACLAMQPLSGRIGTEGFWMLSDGPCAERNNSLASTSSTK